MKSMIALSALASLSLGLATPAAAAKFQSVTPGNPNWTLSSAISLARSSPVLSCTVVMQGTVNNATGVAVVNSVAFSGGPLGFCTAITTPGLPWTLTAPTLTNVGIQTFKVIVPGGANIGPCGPDTVMGNWSGPPYRLTVSNFVVNDGISPPCRVSLSPGATTNLMVVP